MITWRKKKCNTSLSSFSLPHATVLLKHFKQLSPSFLNPSQHLQMWGLVLLQSPNDCKTPPQLFHNFLWIHPVVSVRDWSKLKTNTVFILLSCSEPWSASAWSTEPPQCASASRDGAGPAAAPARTDAKRAASIAVPCSGSRKKGKCISALVTPKYHLIPHL